MEQVKRFNLDRWVGQILSTEEQELSCSDCFDLISEYVEREQQHAALDARMTSLHQHLGQCRVCREEYEMLSDLVQHTPDILPAPGA